MLISKFPLCVCALALCAGFTVRADDTPAQAAARAALMEKMQELQGGSAAAPQTSAPAQAAPAAVTPEVPAQVATPQAAPAQPTPAQTVPAQTEAASAAPMTTQTGDTPAQAAARAALETKMSEMGTPAPSANTVAAQGKTPSARSAAMAGKPIIAPPLPISMSKEDKLAQLLALYRADKISPEQYHEQRAAILAGK
jgi:hypothetical protein